MHASLLMKGLAECDPQADFRFWGGGEMEAVGGYKVCDYRDTAVMGVAEVLAKAGRIRRNLAFCKKDLLRYAPDALILIDYPGFNLKIARFAHSHGLRVFYYIAPKVWASRESRIEQIRRYVDRLYVIFPFEVEYFRSKGIKPVYEGNPLIDSVDRALASAPGREEFLSANSLDPRPLIALLPGSRMHEIKYLAPRFMEVAAMGEMAGFQFAVAAAPGIDREVYGKYFPGIPTVENQTLALLKHSAAAAVASGTASLEAALTGTPQVVCYGMTPVSYHLAIAFLKVRFVSLVNLILDKPVIKELLQQRCTATAIAAELLRLAGDTAYKEEMLAGYARVRHSLGHTGSASRLARSLYDSIAG